MKRIKVLSSRPCDVNYRMKRAWMLTSDAFEFIATIDPASLPEGVHAAMLRQTAALVELIADAKATAPEPKRGRKEPAEVVEPTAETVEDEPLDPSEKYDEFDAG